MLNNLHFTRKSKDIKTVSLNLNTYYCAFHINEYFELWQEILLLEGEEDSIRVRYNQHLQSIEIKHHGKQISIANYVMKETKLKLIITQNKLTFVFDNTRHQIKISSNQFEAQLGSDSLVGLIRSFSDQAIKESTTEKTAQDLFVPGQNDSKNYRIPSMIKTSSNRLLAVIDRRLYHQNDWGDIDLALRYSDDNGKTWSADQIILDTPKDEKNSSFVIDASMVEDVVNKRIHLIVDMFPHSMGFFSVQNGEKPYPFKEGKRVLLDKEQNKYYVDNDGRVIKESDGQETEYFVNLDNSDYTEWGDLYLKQEKIGNISLMNTDLSMVETAYILHMTSDDEGLTWSAPQDITDQIKAEWMYFIGTGPGQGIQMHDHTLVFPIYHTNKNAGYSQSTSLIISKDFGKTWQRQSSPNQNRIFEGEKIDVSTMHNLDAILTESQVVEIDKTLYLFMRNYSGELVYAYSQDHGESWSDIMGLKVFDPYCQVSAIARDKKVFVSSPSAPGRRRGTLKTFELQADHRFVKTNEQVINNNVFEYSCLVDIDENTLGIFYETKANTNDMILKFNHLNIN